MPAGRKAKEPEKKYEPPKDAEEQLRWYRRNSLAWFKAIPHVEDRDSPGRVLPWRDSQRQAQQHKINIWRRARAFNVYRNVKALGLESQAKKCMGNGMWRHQAYAGVQDLCHYGITGFIEDLTELVLKDTGKTIKLHDGPLRMWEGKGRQVGYSYTQQQIQMWRATTRGPSHFLTIAHEDDLSAVIFGYSKITYDYWPEELRWMRPVATGDARKRYEFDNGSTITVRTAGGARIVGRKLDGIHSSELSRYEDPSAFIDAIAALPMHCHLHLESTANGPQGFFYDVANEALPIDTIISLYDQKQNIPTPWVEVFTPWLDDPEYRIPVEDWEQPYLEDKMSEYDLALMRTDARYTYERVKWRHWKLENDTKRHVSLTADQFWMQEFPASKAEMFQHSGRSVFNPERLSEQFVRAQAFPPFALFFADGKAAPRRVAEERQANLFFWERPEPKMSYVIGVDVCRNTKKDKSWVSVWRRNDDGSITQVAEWLGWIGPKYLGDIVTYLAILYNNAFVVPEDNDAGRSTIDTIVIYNGYTNVYIHRPIGVMSRGSDSSVRYGFVTTGPSRQKLVYELTGAIDLRTIEIRSLHMLGEFKTFVFDIETGKAEHADGEHDDGVLSAAFANYGSLPGRGAPSMESSIERVLAERREEAERSNQDPIEVRELKSRLTPEEQGVWKAITEDLKWRSVLNGFDPESGEPLDADAQQQLLHQMEWNKQSSYLPS